jgi:nitrite reductase/ring-hydroxylating ferredoxin subunit/DMSO/TMAO reductase YedYZ heme-binding membrane subunit
MSAGYQAVQWNARKVVYDAIALAAVVIFINGVIAIGSYLDPPKDAAEAADLRIFAWGICAYLMLTFILAIGPLARLDPRFLVLLFNRRHLGVMTFFIAAVHAWYMIEWYQAINAMPQLGEDLVNWPDYAKFIGFPFKALGISALLVLFVMAATSHDFWLAFLTPRVWKALHMALYVAYGLVVMHVALGAMQDQRSPLLPAMLLGCFGAVAALHVLAGWRERQQDREVRASNDGWIVVGAPLAIPDKAARIIAASGGERIAVFRDGGEIGAFTNLCAHQNGPLGEGRIIDGCVTCPWHGHQFRLADGCAPAPHTDKIETYRVRIRDGIVEVNPKPLPPGTPAAIRWADAA